ncbi:hypothetical protein NXS08_01775 [Gleimia sp. 6138-11-ORH1]|uniref:hypothetical protein n=1 Tax=Gleimia sp. 6138-11-ORH1 TaxID=2973937 RepID=UPI00216AA7B0|nr:hypothetical protein [Gleimia sp. 6138-11-ORH1]MCS4484220.1 hypothetical protein [Gleimia sp. 6138-11-ORH1]
MSEARLNLGLRDVNAPGKKPGSGCGCGRHAKVATEETSVTGASLPTVGEHGGCGCGKKRQQAEASQLADNTRAKAAAEALQIAQQLGVDLAEIAIKSGVIEQGLADGLNVVQNPARATDLDD